MIVLEGVEETVMFFLAQDCGGDKAVCSTQACHHTGYDPMSAWRQWSTPTYCMDQGVSMSCRDINYWDK
jgi:hypothetical protein